MRVDCVVEIGHVASPAGVDIVGEPRVQLRHVQHRFGGKACRDVPEPVWDRHFPICAAWPLGAIEPQVADLDARRRLGTHGLDDQVPFGSGDLQPGSAGGELGVVDVGLDHGPAVEGSVRQDLVGAGHRDCFAGLLNLVGRALDRKPGGHAGQVAGQDVLDRVEGMAA